IAGEPERAVERMATSGEIPRGLVRSAPLDDLDSLPFPAWGYFDASQFRYAPYFPAGRGFFPVLSSRGCALSCAYYCPYTAATASVVQGLKRRHAGQERIRRLLHHCDRRGIGVMAFYILGLPSDAEASVAATVDYAKELNTLGAQFTIASRYPGTGFFEAVSA